MLTLLSALGSLLSFRVRSRLTLELELVALRHQLTVLRGQHPGLHHRYELRVARIFLGNRTCIDPVAVPDARLLLVPQAPREAFLEVPRPVPAAIT